jgi:type II secretory pathway pseudopilin PulG
MKTGEEAGTLAEDAAAADPDEPSAADEPSADEPSADEPSDTADASGAPVWVAVMTVLVALLVAGVVTAAVFQSRVQGSNTQAGSRQAAVAVARTAITDLTTANYQNPQQYVDRLKPLAVGNFLSLFTNSAGGFQDVLAEGKVQTTGRVADVCVQRMGAGTAQLTVLAYVTVKNSQTPKGSERVYRLTVSMIQSGSKWLVSNVEFVR